MSLFAWLGVRMGVSAGARCGRTAENRCISSATWSCAVPVVPDVPTDGDATAGEVTLTCSAGATLLRLLLTLRASAAKTMSVPALHPMLAMVSTKTNLAGVYSARFCKAT